MYCDVLFSPLSSLLSPSSSLLSCSLLSSLLSPLSSPLLSSPSLSLPCSLFHSRPARFRIMYCDVLFSPLSSLLSPLSFLLSALLFSSLLPPLSSLLSCSLLSFPFASLLPFPQQASKRLWIAKGYGGPWDPTFFVRKCLNPKSSPLSSLFFSPVSSLLFSPLSSLLFSPVSSSPLPSLLFPSLLVTSPQPPRNLPSTSRSFPVCLPGNWREIAHNTSQWAFP